MSDPPTPITDHRPDVPRPLAEVIDRCLQKDPSLRYENAAELATALEPMAPPASRVIVERARMAMGSTKAATQDKGTLRSPEALAQTAPTPAAWGSGRGESPAQPAAPKKSVALWIGLGVGAAAAMTAVVVVVGRHTDGPAPPSTSSAASAPEPPPPPPVVSVSTSAVTIEPAPLPPASVAPEPAASASAKPVPPARVTPTGRPRPVDDIPSLR